MNNNNTIPILLVSILLLCSYQVSNACSMYKVSVGGKTMVGCNEDAWRITSKIWFENAKKENEYGAAFTGSRKVGNNRFAPQSGMNEVGLVFSRLAAYHPKKDLNQEAKKQIRNEVDYLTDILHQCKTVKEVQEYIKDYDRSVFLDDVFIYVDKSGDYLVVEPYKFIEGNDESYVLANFCPSITSNQAARKQTKFKKGEDYLKTYDLDTSLNFCVALSDTMHVCRNRNGDGTLLTSIWNTQKGLVNLYFYHNYASTVQFKLSKELTKGDHIIPIPTLFPKNAEFERLNTYKTPFNVPVLRVSLVFVGGFLFLLSALYFISYFRNKNKLKLIKVGFSALNILLVVYLAILVTNINIYYFDAPYQHYTSSLITLSSYIPFLLLVLIAPFTFYLSHYIKFNPKGFWIKMLLVFNDFIYVLLLIGFGYWGFFSVV